MARQAGARYACVKCGAELVYEKGCPCADADGPHSEICCGQQMQAVTRPKAGAQAELVQRAD